MLAAACIACIFVGNVCGAELSVLRLLVSNDNAFARETAAQMQKLLERSMPSVMVETLDVDKLPIEATPLPGRVLVTVGDSAWKAVLATNLREVAILAVMPSRGGFESLPKPWQRNVSAIFLDQPVGRWLNLAGLIKPSGARIGVMLGDETSGLSQSLQAAASDRRQRLRLATVKSEAEVGRVLSGIIQDIDVLLAIPDANVHTTNTVQPILLMSYHAAVPVIGYSPGYQRAGAMVVLYTTPYQLAQQAVESVMAFREGKVLQSVQSTKYFTVGANATVARSLGIALPDTEVLEQRLQSMKD